MQLRIKVRISVSSLLTHLKANWLIYALIAWLLLWPIVALVASPGWSHLAMTVIKVSLYVFSFYVAFVGVSMNERHATGGREPLMDRLTQTGKRLVVIAGVTMMFAVGLEGTKSYEEYQSNLKAEQERKTRESEKNDRAEAAKVAESELRFTLMNLLEPFERVVFEYDCPRDARLTYDVGFELVGIDPLEKSELILGVTLSDTVPGGSESWGALFSGSFAQGFSNINRLLAKYGDRISPQAISALAKLEHSNLVGLLNGHNHFGKGTSIEDLVEEELWYRDDIYENFWATVAILESSLGVDEDLLEKMGRMDEASFYLEEQRGAAPMDERFPCQEP